ncbi:MAG TPA: FtsX-like permease family protein [Vicinamibacterales bacterium]|nr:FtsX-like permease family protein [Vicinamibacterales bacterium]
MTPLALAWRTTVRYRARAILAIVGVAVIGALLFDMLLLSRGLLVSFARLLNAEGFDVRIVATQGLTRLPIPDSAALAQAVRAVPGVADVVAIRAESADVRTDRGSRRVTLVGRSGTNANPWRLVRGPGLTDAASPAACEAVVDRAFPSAFGADVGAQIQVTALPSGQSALPAIGCRIVGIADFGFSASGEHTVATTMAALQRAMGDTREGDAEVILVSTAAGAEREAIVRAIGRLRPDVRAYSNADVVEQFDRNGFAYFRQISVVLSTLTTAFAFLLVATLLTVSINQRLGEIAVLRALGIARQRIARMLFWESALLVGVGALAALPLGGVLAVGLDRLLRQMPGLPEGLHFFVFEPRALVVHLAVFGVTAAASAAYPIWLAARLPIAETLRREIVG